MRLFSLQVLSSLLAIKQIASAYAYPTTPASDSLSAVANVRYYPELSERAPPKEVPVIKEPGLATWRGYRALPGLFGIRLTLANVI